MENWRAIYGSINLHFRDLIYNLNGDNIAGLKLSFLLSAFVINVNNVIISDSTIEAAIIHIYQKELI